MRDAELINKANRINLLIDFYGSLLTEKQLTILRLQFFEDLSLSEIAEPLGISRQAVNDHIRRAIEMLEEYESKLRLLEKHDKRMAIYKEMTQCLQHQVMNEPLVANMLNRLQVLKQLEEGEDDGI